MAGLAHRNDLLVDEGTEHGGFQEGRIEGPVLRRLVGEEGGLVKVLELFSVAQPLVVALLWLDHKMFVRGKSLSKVV